MNIRDQIIDIIDELNIITDQDENIIDTDSIAFLSLIVRIEETFGILFPNEFLDITVIQSINDLEIVVNNLLPNR